MPIRQRVQHDGVEGIRVGRLNAGINTTFIIYRIGASLIDTGPPNQWSEIKRFIQEKPVSQLLLTHHHEDHSGNAARIARLCNLTPYAPALSQAKLSSGYRTPALQKFIWGSPRPVDTQVLPDSLSLVDGTSVTAIHTPGHAKDLTCYFMPDKGWLFSGDLYISPSLKYLRSDENLADLICSIQKVMAYDFDVIFCPHKGVVTDGKKAMQQKLDNLLALSAKAQQLNQEGVSIDNITKQLLGPEDLLSKLTRYNICKANLIREALQVPL